MSIIGEKLQSIASAFATVPGLHASVEPPHKTEGAPPIAPAIYLGGYTVEINDYGSSIQANVGANWRIRLAPDIGNDINDELTLLEACILTITDDLCTVRATAAAPQERESGSNYMQPTIATQFTVYLERTQ